MTPRRVVLMIEATIAGDRAEYCFTLPSAQDPSMARMSTGNADFRDYDELLAGILEDTAKTIRRGIKLNQRQIRIRMEPPSPRPRH